MPEPDPAPAVPGPAGDGVTASSRTGTDLPLPISHWRGKSLAVIGFLLLIYLVSAGLYAHSMSSRGVEDFPDAPSDGVSVLVVPQSLDAQTRILTAALDVAPGADLIDSRGQLTADLTIELYPVLGDPAVKLAAGTIPRAVQVTLPVSGDVQNYPFDSYDMFLAVTATVTDPAGVRSVLPTTAGVVGDLVGWTLRSGEDLGLTDTERESLSREQGVAYTELVIRRAGSTLAISLLILSLMVVLAVLGLLVARAVVLGRRRIEATLASWFGAMLFALVPLRGFLPGAPPLGSWIDILIVFWVEVALMLSLAVFVTTWLQRGPAAEPVTRS